MFSTSLDHPYDMRGKYEVALMNMTYTGCVNTFDNDDLTISVSSTIDRLKKTNVPVRFHFDKEWTIDRFVSYVFNDILEFKYVEMKEITDRKMITWRVSPKFCVVLSTQLKNLLQCQSSVLTSWDLVPATVVAIDTKLYLGKDVYVIFVPLTMKNTKIPIKAANELCDVKETIRRFNSRVKIAHIDIDNKWNIEGAAMFDEKHVLLFSPALLHSLLYPQGALRKGDTQKYLSDDYHNARDFKDEGYVSILYLDKIQNWSEKMEKNITLPPRSFTNVRDITSYLKDVVNDSAFTFTFEQNSFMSLRINEKNASIRFSDTLRDIFAFDRNEYCGLGKYRSSGIVSITRRIQYLYVYSNVSDYVRVGNTEAPLLTVIPFEASNKCDSLVEKSFAVPMYVRVTRDYISQIDIYIYDGSGKKVPFVDEAVTSLRLHYREL